jgi:hypothetical protein
MILNERDLERFMSRVVYDTNGNGCWFFDKVAPKNGYPQFEVDGVQSTAHNVSYWHFVGPIQPGKMVHHRCRVRFCVNPNHLEALTRAEHDALGRVRVPAVCYLSADMHEFLFKNGSPMSHYEVLHELGGPVYVADKGGWKRGRVEGWSKRNSIPKWDWRAIERLAASEEKPSITYDLLEQLSKRRAPNQGMTRLECLPA